MMKSASIAAVAFLWVGTLAASAQTSEPVGADAEYNRCIDKPNASNADWQQCGVALVEREDDKLNGTWKRVYAATSGQTKTDLLAEQRLWIPFKDKSCQFYANGDWGREGAVLNFFACRAGVIAERRRALEAYGSFFKL